MITVVDDETGRGVPLAELKTVNEVRYYTDSAGVVAFDEPGLMAGESVFFHVKAHGYEFPADGFGFRGKALKVEPGGSATLKLKRLNLAERLYRVTGEGIYRDSILAGKSPPTRLPLLNAQVLGSDSVLNAIYQGKLFWFWGDTNRPGYPLGNFQTPGATSQLPSEGGLDPSIGVDLDYFKSESGFAAETAPIAGEGPTWLAGLVSFRESNNPDKERLVAGYAKIKGMLEPYEHGLVEFDPAKQKFEKVVTFPLDSAIKIGGHPFLRDEAGQTYIYYADPFPLIRVRAEIESLRKIERYEAWTCLEPGSTAKAPKVARDSNGKVQYAWRANTPVLSADLQGGLIKANALKEDEVEPKLRDIATGKAILAHRGSVNWNAFRKRWVMIAVQQFGESSMLGEVWYAEADHPLGPWRFARKIVSHDHYSFYNPKQHPYFDQDGGALIYFEGTYTSLFSGNPTPTPRYDYNQVMYRLRLDDPRLRLPVAVYRKADGSHTIGALREYEPAAFFAQEQPEANTVPIFEVEEADGSVHFTTHTEGNRKPIFHGLKATDETATTEPLNDREGQPIARVWRAR